MTSLRNRLDLYYLVKRIGIYGGSFDPVHLGHLLFAFAAREEMGLDQLIFVPTNISPFKQEVQPAPVGVRLRMLRLALAGLSWCVVSSLEAERGGVSYSVDTVRSIRDELPGAELFLLVGEDALRGLAEWREAEVLFTMVELLVVSRPGTIPLPEIPGARLHWLKGWPTQVSSSEIRRRVRSRLPVGHLVPAGVVEAIRNNHLYLA